MSPWTAINYEKEIKILHSFLIKSISIMIEKCQLWNDY